MNTQPTAEQLAELRRHKTDEEIKEAITGLIITIQQVATEDQGLRLASALDALQWVLGTPHTEAWDGSLSQLIEITRSYTAAATAKGVN